jgi:PAS domain S-box-containing protein
MTETTYRGWLERELFENAPLNISVIDRNYKIVKANRNFVSLFGEARGRKCYEVHMRRDQICESCSVAKTFVDGKVRVNEEVGVDVSGRTAHYLVHVAPIRDDRGNVDYVIEMSTDITETKRLKLEYQTLFEQVPCYVTVLNRDLRVVRANRRFREKFGEVSGEHCFEVFKRQQCACSVCPAQQTFEDGKIHTSEQVGVAKDGEITHYIVTTAPASRGDAGFSHVIEMAVDVTALRSTEERLRRANALREALVEHSTDAVVGTGPRGNVLLFNPAAEKLFGREAEDLLRKALPKGFLPEEVDEIARREHGNCVLDSATVENSAGEAIPVRVLGHALERDGEYLGTAAFVQDLRRMRQLEREKIDAERLAAVGQTVAGLAHGIKNILTGLEGGMYFLKSGLKGGKQERLDEGWGMLTRNMEKISGLARNLLSFSKGSVPQVAMNQPAQLVEDMVELYRDAAAAEGITVEAEVGDPPAPATYDADAIHICLANLVSNAVDACKMSGSAPCRVTVRTRDEENALIFEVEDEGCGMDQEVRKLAFTNFFSTKGSGGTGLGLLQTRKIAQEHGGRVEFDSEPGKGSVFRLIFPRDRLPKPEPVEETEKQ